MKTKLLSVFASKWFYSLAFALMLAGSMSIMEPASAQKGKAGTTLAASKTIDICELPGGQWRYSGEISVFNEGAQDTQGLTIQDCIQNKVGSGQFVDAICGTLAGGEVVQINGPPGVIPANTNASTAILFTYSFEAGPLEGEIRNIARVKITNHSGQLGTLFGPEPKATWVGEVTACQDNEGCTYTQGYWGNKPGVQWPIGYDRNAPFFNSGLTWQQILDSSAGGNGYIILAHQYIAAVLNQANEASVPSGVQDILNQATTFFTNASTPSVTCPTGSSCGTQKTWAGILDSYNNGTYPGGPPHCGDEEN